ncbi:MAG: hypothetical protein A3J47_03435 [Candidatus Yanofskybacteria bacterium RIFCSPHIGHO2_02_FULL_43_22]|uniref:DUF5680 domain-containing protein n=1 Tax=Candidatus Yanofskybacteria bacterium RIFCSPHIGHO2_02_FULL_43_22 TaxID=1802681 RepID=A0A1F8FLF1_9BACT|nr:MAG: hypothetical protein A3J47_03435 [Candidatus Yanofskybacteria bacterium RIFCSPHIGHO2_02_FULL_43_22]
MRINLQQLADFLEEANKSTYANKDAPKVSSSRLKSEDYHFEKDGLIYHDTYFGGRDFMGGEVIYKDNEPVWGLNYYGFILSETTDEKELYGFLRNALMQEYSDIIPVRGPKNYQNNDWEYNNSADGELDRFTGVEEIYRAGVLVYKCHYHGGFIE